MFTRYFKAFTKPSICSGCHAAITEFWGKCCLNCEKSLKIASDHGDCPLCGSLPLNLICQDGGSRLCSRCDALYHKCRDGSVKCGSPGPLFCKSCNPQNEYKSE